MKKNKIFNIIFLIVIILLVLNTAIAYISYKNVCDKKDPLFTFGINKKEDKIVYKEALYNILIEDNAKARTVSLKLFFLK